MRSNALALLMLAIIVCPTTGVAKLHLTDFAYGRRITATRETGPVRLVIPESIYRHLQGNDSNDIRIFALKGRVVPHIIGRPDSGEVAPGIHALPLFPLFSDASGAGSPAASIPTDASGAILGPGAALSKPKGEPATVYLIDVSQVPNGLEKLILKWRRHRTNVLIKARLEASDDLKQWRPIVDSATLSDIRHGEQRLAKRAIVLPSADRPVPYLRLTLVSGADGVTLEAAEGVVSHVADQIPARQWFQARYRPDRAAAGSMQFDSGGHFPVDQIDLRLSQTNSLVFGTIQSRDSDQTVWHVHYEGAFYQLNMGPETLRNDPVPVRPSRDRYWKLDIDNRQSRLGNSIPRLMLGWRPQELFFVAEQGVAYIFAYGSGKAGPMPPSHDLVATIAAAGKRIPSVDIGPRMPLGGPSGVKTPARAASGRMVSLSTLLLGCVFLLAFLAWWVVRRLLRVD
jgi:hypothetical protein